MQGAQLRGGLEGWAGRVGGGYKKNWVYEHMQQNPALLTHVVYRGNKHCTVKQRYHRQTFKRERPMNQKKKLHCKQFGLKNIKKLHGCPLLCVTMNVH